jgi:hypothetical protein
MEQRLKILIGVAAAVYGFYTWTAPKREKPPVTGPYFYRLMEVGSTNIPAASVSWHSKQVVLCVWPDGRILWSTNTLAVEVEGVPRLYRDGGPPYFQAHVPGERVDAFLSSVATNQAWRKLDGAEGICQLDGYPLMINLETKAWRLFLQPGIDYSIEPESNLQRYSETSPELAELIAAYTNIMSGLEQLIPDTGGTNVAVRFRVVAKPLRANKGNGRAQPERSRQETELSAP